MQQLDDDRYMAMALGLARQGTGRTFPNPMVGAVIVNDGSVVGTGYHPQVGEPHAEVFALQAAGEKARGATAYVTLEPCSHHGRTPPCADALIKAGVTRVVAAMEDPFPAVAGRGLERLRNAGVQVSVGILGAAARRLNEAYLTRVTEHRPFVLWKTAMTLDGKVATRTGDARWVSGPASRREVHLLRNEVDAIIVGIGTVLADDPQLTTRLEDVEDIRHPVRIVVDSLARLPLEARMLQPSTAGRTVVATTRQAPKDRVRALEERGAGVWLLENENHRVSLTHLFRHMADQGMTFALLEGGPTLAAASVRGGWVDKILVFVAPKLVGGNQAPSPLADLGVDLMSESFMLEDLDIRRIGNDVAISAYWKRGG